MTEILSRCGYRCDLCLAYRPNIEVNPDYPALVSAGWQRFFGFLIPPEEIYCDGCLEEDPRLIDKDCPVRPCALERGLENCAHCPDYICERLDQRLVSLESVVDRTGEPISTADRSRFISPYENLDRLEKLRSELES